MTILGFFTYCVFVFVIAYFWIFRIEPNDEDNEGDNYMMDCPFCGSTNVIYDEENEFYVCMNCHQTFGSK